MPDFTKHSKAVYLIGPSALIILFIAGIAATLVIGIVTEVGKANDNELRNNEASVGAIVGVSLGVVPFAIFFGIMGWKMRQFFCLRLRPKGLPRLSHLVAHDEEFSAADQNVLPGDIPADPAFLVMYQKVRSKILAADRLETLSEEIGTVQVLYKRQVNEILVLFRDEDESEQAYDLMEPKIVSDDYYYDNARRAKLHSQGSVLPGGGTIQGMDFVHMKSVIPTGPGGRGLQHQNTFQQILDGQDSMTPRQNPPKE